MITKEARYYALYIENLSFIVSVIRTRALVYKDATQFIEVTTFFRIPLFVLFARFLRPDEPVHINESGYQDRLLGLLPLHRLDIVYETEQ